MSASHEDGYGAEEIRTFLRAVDCHLRIHVRVEIIGGGAAALAYRATLTTEDIDTFTLVNAELMEAVAQAADETGLNIPVRPAGPAQMPQNYEDRLERQLPELQLLEVFTVEKHDLVLSKALRCSEHDRQQILEIHANVGLDFDVLVERFIGELHPYAVGDGDTRRDYFLTVVRDLFGELKRGMAAKIIAADTARRREEAR